LELDEEETVRVGPDEDPRRPSMAEQFALVGRLNGPIASESEVSW
jgi:hypothetical protein